MLKIYYFFDDMNCLDFLIILVCFCPAWSDLPAAEWLFAEDQTAASVGLVLAIGKWIRV